MLSHAEHSRANVFLEPTRLCLLPFAVVFISSNALQLALSHYLRHPPETLPSGEYTPTLHLHLQTTRASAPQHA